MPRIVIKGGVWKNTEDEILKAAISKYGKNQWARISSLLVRKTPKQCKARWYEWLDPSIKKTEWSREEDEKLLHLAKLMPTQWRTIAPIVGRTATQCLERYQKLLDEAEQRDNQDGAVASGSGLGLTGPGGAESAPSADDVRRLRPGEIDPDPETKPARPDAVDMDEDEKEMLSEARARLANTQGKKAKRKARERSLEEARRLALLQKRRELKAAGITTRAKAPKKGMDYMADIPFEKQPVTGFYDTTEEDSRQVRAPVGKTLKQLDNPDHARREEEERKRKEKEAERRRQSEQGKAAFTKQKEEQLRRLQEAEQITKRRKLNLPDAQVGQRELDDIVKMGLASEGAQKLVADGDESSKRLLSQYSALDRAREARTPKTAPGEDTIMREARNLRNMANQQTPLYGDENVEEHGGIVSEGALPSKSVMQTPNPLLTTPDTQQGRNGVEATPVGQTPRASVGGTPLRTPLRDGLGLNADGTLSDLSRREMKRAAQAAKSRLQQGLLGLPAPKNDFELVLDDEQQQEAQDVEADIVGFEEDAAEREARLAKAEAEEYARELARRSQVVQRNLPRPANVDLEAMLAALQQEPQSGDYASRAQHMIAEEMVHLAKHDSIVHPIAGSMAAGGAESGLPTVPDDRLAAARALIEQDMSSALGLSLDAGAAAVAETIEAQLDPGTNEGHSTLQAFEKALEEIRSGLIWDVASGAWRDRSEMSPQAIARGHAAQMEAMLVEMGRQAGVAAKEEKRLGKLLGGYQARSKALADATVQAFRGLSEREVERRAFARLQQHESTAIAERRRALEVEVATLERRERLAQGVFAERDETRRTLRLEVEELEMREAELLNEAALAAADQ